MRRIRRVALPSVVALAAASLVAGTAFGNGKPGTPP